MKTVWQQLAEKYPAQEPEPEVLDKPSKRAMKRAYRLDQKLKPWMDASEVNQIVNDFYNGRGR